MLCNKSMWLKPTGKSPSAENPSLPAIAVLPFDPVQSAEIIQRHHFALSSLGPSGKMEVECGE